MEKKKISIQTVKYIAHLARIELSEEELKLISQQLEKIIDYIDQLKELEIKDVHPTSHILPLENVFRQDLVSYSAITEKVLSSAPQKKDNFFVVPKVIE
jgi:aspartyl-tRNA(Asn)/glutamyl-tRNA(Gln) amidotransferase subunit C